MALYKRTELCVLLKISQAVISMAVQRGHLIPTGKLIDGANPTNEAWIQKKLAAKGNEMPAAAPASVPESRADRKQQVAPATPKAPNEQFQLTNYKIKAQVEKILEETEVVKLKKQKLQAENLPIDVIRHILVNNYEALGAAFEFAADDWTLRLQNELMLTREQQVKIKAAIVEVVNKAKIQAAADTKKSLRRIQQEYANTKGKGEHD